VILIGCIGDLCRNTAKNRLPMKIEARSQEQEVRRGKFSSLVVYEVHEGLLQKSISSVRAKHLRPTLSVKSGFLSANARLTPRFANALFRFMQETS
jgi:hypothetical protein